MDFVVKDSGKRQEFDSGMRRDVTDEKPDFSLVFDGPLLRRWAQHLTNGAKKYSKRNWMKAASQEEYERFKESAARHFCQLMAGETDEDHYSAVVFNLNGMLYTAAKLPHTITNPVAEPYRAGHAAARGIISVSS